MVYVSSPPPRSLSLLRFGGLPFRFVFNIYLKRSVVASQLFVWRCFSWQIDLYNESKSTVAREGRERDECVPACTQQEQHELDIVADQTANYTRDLKLSAILSQSILCRACSIRLNIRRFVHSAWLTGATLVHPHRQFRFDVSELITHPSSVPHGAQAAATLGLTSHRIHVCNRRASTIHIHLLTRVSSAHRTAILR